MNVPTMNKQIIFVDSSVQDYQNLIQGIDPAQIVIFNENSSAIDQITNALTDKKDIEAVHIVSHGSEGSLKLGADVLNENNLETFSNQLKQWGNALTANGDILLYGCDVAAGEVGENFVKRLSEITGADVAASTDKTGNAALGGDWELEKTTGSIEAGLALSSEAIANYAGVLAPPVQFDLTSVFDSDVIINYTGGVTDTTQSGLDSSGGTLITQSFATFKAGANGNGLPDNGFFATNAYHPDVQLGYNNTNNGNNAKVLTANGTSFNFAVTPNQYSEIHLLATSSNGDAGMQVTFNYSDGTTGTATATVPDWFNEITTESFSSYYLIDGRDRSFDKTGTSYHDANDVALFGFGFNPNPAKTLQSITVTKTTGSLTTNYLGVLGATGVLETTPPTAASFTPADNATSVAVAADLVVTLSEAVQKGTGNIVIKKVSDNSVVETINVTSTNVTVTGSTVTINPVADLAQGTGYYVEIAAGAIQDLAGNNYAGTTGATAWNFTTADTTPPTVSLTSAAAATVTAAFPVTATFSESTTNFIASDITVTNGTVSGFSGTGTTYNFTVTPTGQGTVTVNVPTGVATDAAGNNNTAATALTRTFDSIAPTVSLTSAAAATVTAAFPVTATFSESTTNFIASDITVTNGTVSGFSGTGTTYNFTVTPTGSGTVTVNIPANIATDAAGNNNTAATALTRTADTTAPTAASFTPADNATSVAVAADLV
ncbi:DUF4347 domain-containing protein, partial [Microcoleus sp. Pol11C2]|uniref:DUF4347 domain-containing protein n=1 Tax=Microcoleus sp. Pol11C2 TaxID=3055389 RepID=UPI002FD3A9FA